MSDATTNRSYPDRPFLAVSAAIIRHGKVLLVRRARAPMHGLFTLPGGVVEAGETLDQALRREVLEETALRIEPIGIAGTRDVILRDQADRLERHFVIIAFAARLLGGDGKDPDIEPQITLNEELADARWLRPAEMVGLETTEGLGEIIAAAFAKAE